MIKKLMHNWQWKLLALVISFVFWAMIVNFQDPVKTVKFDNVPVIIENSDAINSRNLAIEYLDGKTVDVVLRGKRTIIQNLSIDDVRAYADLSRVSVTDAVNINVDAGEEIEVLSKTPNEMLISLEEIIRELKSVQVRYVGDLAKDYVKLNAVVTPNQIELTGTKSKLALVSSVVVPIDIGDADNDVTVFVAPQVLDANGDEVRGVELGKNQIQIKVPIQKIKIIPIAVAPIGELDMNFRLMSMELEAKSVTIRGEDEDIDGIMKLIVNDVDLSTMDDTVTEMDIDLGEYLDEDVHIYNVQETMTKLLFDIELIRNSSYIVDQADINVKEIPEGLQFQFSEEEPYVIGVKGIFKELNALDVEDMQPRLNLKGLEVGVHELELQLTLPKGFELSSDLPVVKIELTEVPVEEVPEEGTEGTPETTTTE